MPLDPSISLKLDNPNPTTLLSGMLDIGSKGLAYRQAQDTYDADVARSRATSQTAQAQAKVATANVDPLIRQQAAQTSTAESQSSVASLENIRAHAAHAVQQFSQMLNDPTVTSDRIRAAATSAAANAGAPKATVDAALQGLPPNGDAPALRNWITQRLAAAQGVTAHLNSIAPSPTFVNNGQQTTPVASGPAALTGVQPGTPQGVPTQMQVPPTATTMRGGQPGYVGATPPQTASSPPIASGPALGQSEGVAGMVGPNVEHFKTVVADASAAPTRIGILQEIKSLAPHAITGDAPALKKVISKLAAYTGWTGSEQTPTDVMAKESAMLAAKSGNTDLARALGEMATPNGHMTKEAIAKTADQLIGQEKTKQAAQEYFTGTPPDSPLYGEKLKLWSKAADPRAFEYAAKTPAEQAAMKAEMVKAGTWEGLRQKMIQLHVMGINP